MKERYDRLQIEILVFDEIDIITSSGNEEPPYPGEEFPVE